MRCYYVFVHGKLTWKLALTSDENNSRPHGFFCHRFVLASNEQLAMEIAFARVRANFRKQNRWLINGSAILDLEAAEIHPAPIYNLLKPDNRGHSFYA